MPNTPAVGRIVHYQLTHNDVANIMGDRNARPGFHGNQPQAGDVLPAIVVRSWSANLVNLKVFLDGRDDLWVTSRSLGDEEGHWSWPART